MNLTTATIRLAASMRQFSASLDDSTRAVDRLTMALLRGKLASLLRQLLDQRATQRATESRPE